MIYGIGIGLAYFPILKSSWKYFPEKKGLLTGIILCVFGLCPMVFTSIADYVINPEHIKPINGIYDSSIAERMKNYSFIMVIVFSCCGLLSQILMFPLDNIESTDKEDLKDKETKPKYYNNYGNTNINKTKDYEDMNTNDDNIENIKLNQPFKQAALSIRFHLFNFMSLGTLVFGFFSGNSTRTFGSLKKIDENFLQTMSKICGFINGFFRIIWGFIYECLGFRIPYTIVCSIQITCSSLFYIAAKNKYTYLIVNIIENIGFSGHGTIAPPLVAKIFGIKNSIKLLGITGYYLGISSYVLPLITKFYVNGVDDYLIIYLIGTGFAFMSLIICLTIRVDKFVYNEYKKIQNKTKGSIIDTDSII